MLDLAWDAPDECPTGAEVSADVMHIVGSSETRHVVVHATVQKDGPVWTLVLDTQSGEEAGQRTLHGATCAEVAKAGVIVMALTLDPNGMSPPPTAVVAPPAPVVPPPPVIAPAAPVVPRAVWATLRIEGGAAFATLPSTAPFAAVAAGARLARGAARLGVAGLLENSESAPAGSSGSFWLFSTFADVCGAPIAARRFELWACVGAQIDRMAAAGHGVTSPSTAVVWWLAPRVGLEPSLGLIDRLRLVLPLEVSFPLYRPTFTLDGVGPVFRPALVFVRVSLGAEVRF